MNQNPSYRKSSAGYAGFWLIGFMLLIIACQVLLLFQELQPVRFIIRASGFGLSLFFLVFFSIIPYQTKPHPAQKLALVALIILMLSFAYPKPDSLIGGFFHLLLYLAILAPLFWVPKFGVDLPLFRKLIFLFWGFHMVSSVLGILQVYYPEKFEPPLSVIIDAMGESYVNSLKFELESGMRVFRPMGLTDMPGGAAGSGFYTLVFGFGFLLNQRNLLFKVISVASIVIGLVVVALSFVRIFMVLNAIFLVSFLVLSFRTGGSKRFLKLLIIMAIVLAVGLTWAIRVGGEDVKSRLATLIEGTPITSAYNEARGHFLDYTIKEVMPQYPLGAGLARWGMISHYFNAREPLYAEIQLTGWVYDGGIPLTVVYLAMLFSALFISLKITGVRRIIGSRELAIWAALIFAHNVGAIAAILNSPFFMSQGGLLFWLFNAILYSLYQVHLKSARPIQAA